ncbi:hypothetical protein Tco_0720240 [Tanacetum coccineum]
MSGEGYRAASECSVRQWRMGGCLEEGLVRSWWFVDARDWGVGGGGCGVTDISQKSYEVSARPCKNAHLLEDKQILSVEVFDEHLEKKHVTWARFEEKVDKNTTIQAGDFYSDTFAKSA